MPFAVVEFEIVHNDYYNDLIVRKLTETRVYSQVMQLCALLILVIAVEGGVENIYADESSCSRGNSSCLETNNTGAFFSRTGTGLLRVHPSNPIYFTDDSGRAIYLAGHQIFVDLQDNTFGNNTTYNQQAELDWRWYLQFAKARNLNYLRNWTLMSTGCGVPLQCAVAYPMPYKRIPGSGNANDWGGEV